MNAIFMPNFAPGCFALWMMWSSLLMIRQALFMYAPPHGSGIPTLASTANASRISVTNTGNRLSIRDVILSDNMDEMKKNTLLVSYGT